MNWALRVLVAAALFSPFLFAPEVMAAGTGQAPQKLDHKCKRAIRNIERSLRKAGEQRPRWSKATPSASIMHFPSGGPILEIGRSGRARFDGVDLIGSSPKQRVADFKSRVKTRSSTNVRIWVHKNQRMQTMLPYVDVVPRQMGIALVVAGRPSKLSIYSQLNWVDGWLKTMRSARKFDERQEKLFDGIVRAANDVSSLVGELEAVRALPAQQQLPELLRVLPNAIRATACAGVAVSAMDDGLKVAANNYGRPFASVMIYVRKGGSDRRRAKTGTVQHFLDGRRNRRAGVGTFGLVTTLSKKQSSTGSLQGGGILSATSSQAFVSVKVMSASGGLSKGTVSRGVYDIRKSLRVCFTKNGTKKGQLSVNLKIDIKGRVSQVDVIKLERVRRSCAVSILKAARFKSQSPASKVSLRFSFYPPTMNVFGGLGSAGTGRGGGGTGFGTIGLGSYGLQSKAVVTLGRKNVSVNALPRKVRFYGSRARHRVETCHYNTTPIAGDKARLVFEVEPSGRVASVKVTMRDKKIGRCIETAIKKAKFPKASKLVKVDYEFSLKPNARLSTGIGSLGARSGYGGGGTSAGIGSGRGSGYGRGGLGSGRSSRRGAGYSSWKVTVDKLTVSTGLLKARVRGVIDRAGITVRVCYPRDSSRKSVKTTVSLTIGKAGVVTGVSFVDADPKRSVGACVVKRMLSRRFTTPTQAPVKVTYELTFARR